MPRPARPTSEPNDVARRLVPRLALSKAEAAEALGVSVDFLEEHVMGELRIVRRGRRRLIPLSELQRWLEESAAPHVGGHEAGPRVRSRPRPALRAVDGHRARPPRVERSG